MRLIEKMVENENQISMIIGGIVCGLLIGVIIGVWTYEPRHVELLSPLIK